MESIRSRALAWCQEGRNYKWRSLLLAYGLFILVKILRRQDTFTPLDFLNLGIHELGHIVAMPFGEWIGIFGGSFAQVLAPIYGIWQFSRQNDFFAAAFGFGWLGESLYNVSIYIADARSQELPLANLFGGDPIHDWNYLLGSANFLTADARFAGMAKFLALLSTLGFLWMGSWLIWQMATKRR